MAAQFWLVVHHYMQHAVGSTEVAGLSINNVFASSKMLTWERPFSYSLLWWFEKQLLGNLPLPKSAQGLVEQDALSWSKSLSVCSWDRPTADTTHNGVYPKIALLCWLYMKQRAEPCQVWWRQRKGSLPQVGEQGPAHAGCWQFVRVVRGEAEHVRDCTLSHCACVQDRLITALGTRLAGVGDTDWGERRNFGMFTPYSSFSLLQWLQHNWIFF